jgi:hypothetical protein
LGILTPPLTTGKEVARLLIEETRRQSRGEDSSLTDAETSRLINDLEGREGPRYNRYLTLERKMDDLLALSQIHALKTGRALGQVVGFLQLYRTQARMRWLAMMSAPPIVTPKQLEELTEKQRQRRLKERIPLHVVVEDRAHQLAPDDVRDDWEWEDDENVATNVALYAQAAKDIAELVDADTLTIKGRKRDIESASRRLRDGRGSPSRFYSGALTRVGVLVEELCDARLPEWVERVEGLYDPCEDEEAGTGGHAGVAVIPPEYLGRFPLASKLDGAGHYVDDWAGDATHLAAVERTCMDELGHSLVDQLSERIEGVKDDLRLFRTFCVGVEAVSRHTGVGWSDDMNCYRAELALSLTSYNTLAKPAFEAFHPDEFFDRFPPLDLDEMEPDAQFLDGFRRVINEILAEEWGDEWLPGTPMEIAQALRAGGP